jgi:cell division protein FtsW
MARKLFRQGPFVALVALSLFGCVMIYSASAVSAAQTLGNPYKYLIKQIAALVVGGLAAFAVYRADYRLFGRQWVGYAVYGLSLALCVAALFRPPINSARRWLTVGPLMLQPSEILKIGLVLVLARLVTRRASGPAAQPERALPAALLLTGLAAGVVLLEPDLGTAASYLMLCGVVLWLSGVRVRLFLIGLAGMVPLLAVLALSASYRRARLLSFLNPEADPLGAGFQAIQSLIAVGAGGVSAAGWAEAARNSSSSRTRTRTSSSPSWARSSGFSEHSS